MWYCPLQHWTLLPSSVTSTAGCCFCFESFSLFFLELFLHWSPITYLACTDLGSSSFSVLSFYLFILFLGFSREKYWSGLPFTSPVDHVFSEVSTVSCPSCVAYMAWLIVSLSKTRLWSMWSDWLVFCDCGFQSVCPLMEKDKRLMEAPWLERLTEGGTGSYTRVAQKFSTWWWNDFSMCSGTKTAASFITWIEKCAHMAMYLEFSPRI